MRRQEEADKAEQRRALQQGKHYAAIELPADMGLDCQRYKWRQNQSHVEVFVLLPPSASLAKVHVLLSTKRLEVIIDENPVISGLLYREIKADESTWYVQDGMLEVIMLKRNRRGSYEKGSSNADTFWKTVIRDAAPHEMLQLDYPPLSYYSAPCEGGGEVAQPRRSLRHGTRSLQAAEEGNNALLAVNA